MSCCVPGCTNLIREWTSGFPRDGELQARWKAAIRAGTGFVISGGCDLEVVPVCNMHFTVKSTDDDAADKYREPSLFVRENVLLEVSWCRLCFRHDVIDNMLDLEDCFEQGDAPQWMARKYSGSIQLGKDEVLFCDECIARVTKTDEMEQEIFAATKKIEQLLQKMTKEGFAMKRVKRQENNDSQLSSRDGPEDIIIKKDPETVEISESGSRKNLEDFVWITNDIAVKEEPELSLMNEIAEACSNGHIKDLVESPEDIIVKEEPQLTEPDNPSSKTGWHKCKLCDASYRMLHQLVRHIKTIHPNAASIRKNQNQWVCHTQTGGQKRVRRANGHQQLASKLGGESRKETVCLLCKQLFPKSRDIVAHFQEVHADTDLRYYPCPLCDEVFFGSSSIRSHVSVHEAVYSCDLCEKTLSSNDALINHRHTFHGEKLSEDRYVKCPICKKKRKRYNFRKHCRPCKLKMNRKAHIEEKPLTCPRCAKQYKRLGCLILHEKVCTGSIVNKSSFALDEEKDL